MSIAALLAVQAVIGCAPDPNAPPIYRTNAEYLEHLQEVEMLTKSSFEAVHDGFPLNDEEKAKLRKADKIIDGLIAYKSDGYGPWILKGLTQRALGNRDQALRAYQQGLNLAPKEMTTDDMNAVARIHDELTSFYFEEGDFKTAELHADEAVKLMPDVPSLLTNAAGVKIQLKKTKEADDLLKRALKIDPKFPMALNLQKLMAMGNKKTG